MKHDESTKRMTLRNATLPALADAELMAVVGGRPSGGSKSGGSKPVKYLTYTFETVTVSSVAF